MVSTQKQKTAFGGSVAGLLNDCTLGSIVPDGCSYDGKSVPIPTKPFYTWPVLFSASANVIAPDLLNWLLRFPNTL
jgi:hypothetical protein